MRLLLLILTLWAASFCEASSQPPPMEGETDSVATDSSPIYISLLTCSPGTEPYTLFGHTAIHMRCDSLRDFDFVFNYGLFDYRSENFVFRFVKGETDYELGAEPTDFFMGRYVDVGHTVWEQELNLTKEEKEWLFSLIVWNAQPKNKTYRYNFLYDNCTTRARDALQRALQDVSIVYPPNGERLTFRDIIHQFTAQSPWVEFGIDMVLGCEMDRVLDERNKMFIPSRLHDLVAGAEMVYADGTAKPLVRQETIYTPKEPLVDAPAVPLTPMQLMWGVLVLTLVLSWMDWRRGRVQLWWDVVLLAAQGIAGLLVAFLFFCSEHPAVGTNWLIIPFNPLAFVLMVMVFRRKSKLYRVAEYVNMAGIAWTLLLFVLPLQQLPLALLPLVLSLLLRGVIRLRI